jgi:hypothetical protein
MGFAPCVHIYHKYPVNVLVLTPDAVGSTLLQRLLTIYMQFHEFDRPVINLHELTNGLEKYYSPEFGREIVSKRKVKSWEYYQSLQEIVEILASVDHYKTSRLAQYHIKNRNDPIEQQIPFYRYLDDNFFIIACRRHNVFEHGLSMALNKVTKKLNVYDHNEKIETFRRIYQDKVQIDLEVFVDSLDSYKNYVDWSGRYFNVGSYFYYDEQIGDIERYILALPVFHGQTQKITWQDKFDLSLNDWNRCHHIPSNLGAISFDRINSLEIDSDTISEYQQTAPLEWPPVVSRDDFSNLPMEMRVPFLIKQANRNDIDTKIFFQHNQAGYQNAQQAIKRMQELDIIVSPPPIKKQTLREKSMIVENFDQCMATYNQWVDDNPGVATAITRDQIDQQILKEQDFWNRRDIIQKEERKSLLVDMVYHPATGQDIKVMSISRDV